MGSRPNRVTSVANFLQLSEFQAYIPEGIKIPQN